MEQQTRPEPMNASPHHSKVKVSLTMGNSLYVAGGHVSGKMEMECRADKGLGIGVMMVELTAVQELTSRDHSATSTFLRSRRVFQGPGLPPSNAVQAHPLPGDPPLPPNYYHARRGMTTFLFRIPLPTTSPSSINFGSGIARVRYEVKASVQVAWKGENKLVTDKKEIDVVESFEEDFGRSEPEGVVVGENGKIWVQGKVVGGVVVAGESACVELQVKNHSNKKNTGLTITLSRHLHLPGSVPGQKAPLQLSDTLITVPYRGQEYIIPPGAEGVASLVFDVPKSTRGVKGGTRDDDEGRTSESLFEVRCIVGVKLNMGIGSKDINLDIPVTVAHPAALPALPDPAPYLAAPYAYPSSPPEQVPLPPASVPPPVSYVDPHNPYGYPALPMSPPIPAYIDQSHVWLPPPPGSYAQPYNYFSPPLPGPSHPYYFAPTPAPEPTAVQYAIPPRPSSTGPSSASHAVASGLPITSAQNPVLPPLDTGAQHYVGPEEGKGERASRITQHLRLSSRHRSVSPQSHRFPMPTSAPAENATENLTDLTPIPGLQPQSQILANVSPLADNNVSLSPPDATKVVHSPRPLLSPKHSFSIDPVTKNSFSKSERVEALERMAEAVDKETKDLSADIPKVTALEGPPSDSNVNKTLPTPPSTSLKNKVVSPLSASRPRVDQLFVSSTSQSLLAPEPVPSDQAPPTPTLTAIPFAKRPKSKDNLLGPTGPTESGLDALERRLLAEVGTRKFEDNVRPDVRSVLPIAIPSTNTKPEPLNDSAISSLTLADHGGDLGMEHIDHDDWDDRTHKAAKSSLSGDDREKDRPEERGRDSEAHGRGSASGSGKVKSQSGRTKDGEKRKKRAKDSESHKMRKAAKGRIAAWLGGVEPAVPPPDESPPPIPSIDGNQVSRPTDDDPPAAVPVHEVEAESTAEVSGRAEEGKPHNSEQTEGVSSIPNPRSSGFVPIGTFKREAFHRYPTGRGGPFVNPAAEEAKNVASLWSSDADDVKKATPMTLRASPPAVARTIRTEARVSPPSSSTAKGEGKRPAFHQLGGLNANPVFPPSKKLHPSQRLPVFPPPHQDPEVKYDIRSARGGRGGKVTAVAAIWAAGAFRKGDEATKATKTVSTPVPLPKKRITPPADKKSNVRLPPSVTAKPPLLLAAAKKSSASSAASSDGSTVGAPDPKPLDAGGKRATARVIKSPSVPAMVSSSLATPVLSTTASLARPVTAAKSPVKVPPTIIESNDTSRTSKTQQQGASGRNATSGTKNGPAGELAFGQARLRDLIRKYQGQAT